jgi:hypothetical protein
MILVDLEPRDGSGRSDVRDPSSLLVVPDWRWLVPRRWCRSVIGLNSTGQAQSKSLIESVEGGCESSIGVEMPEEKDWEDRQDEGSVLS